MEIDYTKKYPLEEWHKNLLWTMMIIMFVAAVTFLILGIFVYWDYFNAMCTLYAMSSISFVVSSICLFRICLSKVRIK